MPEKRVTLRDIGTACKVTAAAVSLALHNHPSIPPATRERIRAAAQRLGYRPDPALAALNAYRRQKLGLTPGVTIGYLTCFDTALGWKRDLFFRETYGGAKNRATALGYRLEHFWMNEPGVTSARMAQVLESRGIRGLLVAPLPGPGGTIELPWERFATVAIGPSLSRPMLHSAATNHYQVMQLALERLRASGYRRIGFVVDVQVDLRHQKRFEAAFQLDQQDNSAPRDRIPMLLRSAPDAGKLRAWLQRTRPDVVIHHDDKLLAELIAVGWPVPRAVGFASLNCLGDPRVTGISIPPALISATAVDRLHMMLHENETGVPARPTSLVLNGTWVAGETAPETRRNRART